MVIPSGVVVLTDRRLAARPLPEVVAAAIRGGAAWVVLRERDLGYGERRALAESLRAVVPVGRLVIAGPDPLGGDAVHLSAADPVPAGVGLIGRSCHGVPRLSTEDYVTLSPVYPTPTKPGYGPALGPSRAAALAGAVPWLALGGVHSPERAAACAAAGAAGIAILGAVMRADDPEAVTRALADAFAAAAAGMRAGGPAAVIRSEAGVEVGVRAGGPGAVIRSEAGVGAGVRAGGSGAVIRSETGAEPGVWA
ncbi:thiamine phosphate synthase [Actinoplanes sp. ATCC 53533]|nr:thiamine phosphate synthase [Actinoplanes sp. ATCC 53533]RSM68985.1 thiamine phosphate synthase [Actinoplanes sp. ATCC 53533]